jgi:hypothetical protein
MGQPVSILIVEDSENDARLLVRKLRRGGFETRIRAGGDSRGASPEDMGPHHSRLRGEMKRPFGTVTNIAIARMHGILP